MLGDVLTSLTTPLISHFLSSSLTNNKKKSGFVKTIAGFFRFSDLPDGPAVAALRLGPDNVAGLPVQVVAQDAAGVALKNKGTLKPFHKQENNVVVVVVVVLPEFGLCHLQTFHSTELVQLKETSTPGDSSTEGVSPAIKKKRIFRTK